MDTTKNDPKPCVDLDEVLFFMREIVDAGRDYLNHGDGRLPTKEYRSEYHDVALAIAVSVLYQAVHNFDASRTVEIKL